MMTKVYLSEFISKHLVCDLPIVDCKTVCKMCGKSIRQGVNRKDIIKKQTFNDYQHLRYNSEFLCAECSALIGTIDVNQKKTWLRNFSFVCDEDKLCFLKREELWDIILNPPQPPFVFCVTYSNKKHVAFKSKIQYSNNRYKIFTDKGEVEVIPKTIDNLMNIIQSWYSIIPEKQDTKQQPTWFTKSEILQGGKNYKNINQYGIDKYMFENEQLKEYRNTRLLNLLTFAVNKK